MAEVVFEHIEKRFTAKGSEVVAVNDLSLTVLEGEFLVLVGPSGCGKTTALRMVAGLEDPTGGSMYIAGRRVNDVAPKDRDIAMVFQNYALYPHMNVFDNMAFGLRMRNTAKDEIKRRIEHAAEMLDISALLKRKPKELSGGQRQRVALGRAIVRQPVAFLMDEPLSNLDAKLRVQTRAELIKLHQRLQTTTIYVTHDQTEAMTMGSRIAVMKGGVLQQLDTPQHLYDEPVNLFVAGFIGSPAMNFAPCRVAAAGDGLEVHFSSASLALPPRFTGMLQPFLGKDLVFGIRPEHITEHREEQPSSITAVADVVEPLGSDAYVTLALGSDRLMGRFDPRHQPRIGDTVRASVDMNRAHFFDPATEAKLA